mgnify:CR=1 FL=1
MRIKAEEMTDAQRGSVAGGRLRYGFPGLSDIERSLREKAIRFISPGAIEISRAEPLLKRSIPILITLFLLVVAAARAFGIYGEAARMEDAAILQTQLTASAVAGQLAARKDLLDQPNNAALAKFISSTLPAGTDNPATSILVSDATGFVIAASAASEFYRGRYLPSLAPDLYANLSDSDPTRKLVIAGVENFTTFLPLESKAGYVLAMTPTAAISGHWREEISLNVTLFTGISAIILVILYAYYTQAKRARDADEVFVESNMRVESALSRGRCGLWDFDMTDGRLFWSRSMYEMLGMPPRDSVLSFGDIARMMHPDDKSVYSLARGIARGDLKQVDQVFRVRHASGHYVWLRARAQIINSPSRRAHLIGIAMDVTEQHKLAQRYAEADQRQDAQRSCSGTRTTGW